MRRNSVVTFALLLVSLFITVCFVVGSFVSYAPTVDATTIQNIYLKRILLYGCLIAFLDLLAIAFIERKPR
jgi:hypothetical protein